MENQLIIREYIESKIIMIQDEDKNVWFKGVDAASILGYSDKKKAIRMHVDEDEKKQLNELMGGQNGFNINFQPHTFFINESGLYSLILSSKLEGAKKFKKWITKDVIPSIRKTGTYTTQPKIHPEKLREIQLKEIQVLHSIKDSKLKQAWHDRLLNEITGEKQSQQEYSRDLITILKEEFNKNIDFIEASKLGKYIIKKYREKYQKSPEQYMKFVNGNNRMVFCYSKLEEKDLIKWITEVYK
jgi:prophage antirepressor-like protein